MKLDFNNSKILKCIFSAHSQHMKSHSTEKKKRKEKKHHSNTSKLKWHINKKEPTQKKKNNICKNIKSH